MFLDERKLNILKAIIDDYIDLAEPIGSRHIAKNHQIGLSSATIRNEMADLEEMGFLEQPHTSAGRIPSDKAYRLYVEQLMNKQEISDEDLKVVVDSLEYKIKELSQLIRQASSVISKVTNYTAFAVSPDMGKSILKAIQVVPIEPGRALVIIVTTTGILRNELVAIPHDTKPDFLIACSNYLNNKLTGLSLKEISMDLLNDIRLETGIDIELLAAILESVVSCITEIDRPEVYLDGFYNMLNHPEFQDVSKAQKFIQLLNQEGNLEKIIYDGSQAGSSDMRILIGEENQIEEMKGCSLLTATYTFGDEVLGTIGVIGPKRMDYSKAISYLNLIRNQINREINLMLGREEE